jgi:hypothetical protein
MSGAGEDEDEDEDDEDMENNDLPVSPVTSLKPMESPATVPILGYHC